MKPVASAGSSTESPPPTRADDPTVIAHRGFAGAYPENTHIAMRAATTPIEDPSGSARFTADAVEIDVVPCATGELVVFHDAYLGRLTNASGELADRTIWETPFDRLRELEVLGTGETIPLLAELLETIPARVMVTVELKNPGTAPARTYRDLSGTQRGSYDRAWERMAEGFVEAVAGFDHGFLLTSSFEGALGAIREYAPEFPLGYLFWDSIDAGVAITRRYECDVCCPPRTAISGTDFFNDAYGDLAEGTFAERDLIGLAHEEGREVYAWTIDTWRQATDLGAAGVDGLLCEYPGLLDHHAPRPSAVSPADD